MERRRYPKSKLEDMGFFVAAFVSMTTVAYCLAQLV